MSDYQQKDNSGALFKNDKKQSDTQPDYRGDVVVNGESMWISAWINESAKGTKYMKLAFTPKDDTAKNSPFAGKPSEDIPF